MQRRPGQQELARGLPQQEGDEQELVADAPNQGTAQSICW